MIKGEPINWDRVVFGVCIGIWIVFLMLLAFGEL